MDFITIIIFIFSTGLGVAILLKFLFGKDHNWMDAATIEEAEAIILRVELKNYPNDHKSRIRLQMQVQPDKGRNFVAEMEDVLIHFNLSILKTGSVVKVQYNPQTKTLLHIIAA